jgi:hypothetical protein
MMSVLVVNDETIAETTLARKRWANHQQNSKKEHFVTKGTFEAFRIILRVPGADAEHIPERPGTNRAGRIAVDGA